MTKYLSLILFVGCAFLYHGCLTAGAAKASSMRSLVNALYINRPSIQELVRRYWEDSYSNCFGVVKSSSELK
jgi:hypothetical protein